ncbi:MULTISPECIES: hypothetical protein [Ruegeria]|uniref:hypothetical protein n=1 Tax=Ruegeria TaxID=97050 RepID=UPI00147F9ADB|nr:MULTISPECIES: hypothetical protein [Ruegeria]MBO9411571.1 hypothetical protein [Ruegeria sp. R8_1]MBO9415867.1 hypothetical protein [Ruegeria sp. R8_2]
MPLGILLVLVIGGIAGITLMMHLAGKSRITQLTPDSAKAAWLRHVPGDEVVDVTITNDGHTALIRTPAGNGLVWSFGADTVARHLLDFDRLDRAEGFEIRFHDFATPKVLIRLDDFERQHWQNLMEPV